ncbi:collagen alpha-1(XIX) chain-like [Pelodytes ibericus]
MAHDIETIFSELLDALPLHSCGLTGIPAKQHITMPNNSPNRRTVCPVLRGDGALRRQNINLEMSGYDLAERFSLRQTSCGGEKTCFKLGGTPLIRDTQQMFPSGLPEEYSVIAIFRVRRNTKKERWFLWQTLTRFGTPQDSIIIDGSKKVVELTAKHKGGIPLHYTFKSRELHHLFDRQWHKLEVGIQSNIISLYVDCKLIERKQTSQKDSIDFQGNTIITTSVSDGKPVDIELQGIAIYCSPKHAAQENCCEISDEMCVPQDIFITNVSSPVGKLESPQTMDQVTKEKCYCSPNKGEAGLPGSTGLPGLKGEKGLQGEKGNKGEIGLSGAMGEKDKMGVQGYRLFSMPFTCIYSLFRMISESELSSVSKSLLIFGVLLVLPEKTEIQISNSNHCNHLNTTKVQAHKFVANIRAKIENYILTASRLIILLSLKTKTPSGVSLFFL